MASGNLLRETLGIMALSRERCSCIVPLMAKAKSRYVCQACGSVSSRWQGQCADCAEWNTLVQEAAEVSSIFAAKHNLQGGGRVIQLVGLETAAALPERLPSGLAEFDRAIGGGIVAGSAMLVGGDPGHRQVDPAAPGRGTPRKRGAPRSSMSRARNRPSRCGSARSGWALARAPVQLAAATSVRDILTTVGDGEPPALLIIDSIQTMHSRPDRRRAGHGQPGSRLGAGAGALRQGAWHRGRSRRPCHQGRHDRRPARARAYGRHGAELRRRAQPPVPDPPRDEEPLRRHRRDRRFRDGRAGADRSPEPLRAVSDPSRRAGQRDQRASRRSRAPGRCWSRSRR